MDLKQLEYFSRVAELGSFTRAARALNVAQPALSRQVRRLEVELRKTLLKRNGRGVTTTEAGKLLLRHCRGILHQVDRAREDMSRVEGTLTGHVAVGIPPSVSRVMTVQFTQAFRRQLPNATLSVSEGLSLVMKEWLLGGRLDIALLYNPDTSAGLDLQPLTTEPLYLVAAKDRQPGPVAPVPLASLAGVPLVVPNRPNTIRVLLESQMALLGCRPSVRLEIDSVPAILDLVADNAGCAVLSEHAVLTSPDPTRYDIRPIVQPELSSHLCAATASQHIMTLTQQATLDLIRKMVKDAYPASMTHTAQR